MNSFIIHDNICAFTYKECHPKSYRSDIKCHMTLNSISTIVSMHNEAYDITFVVKDDNVDKKL